DSPDEREGRDRSSDFLRATAPPPALGGSGRNVFPYLAASGSGRQAVRRVVRVSVRAAERVDDGAQDAGLGGPFRIVPRTGGASSGGGGPGQAVRGPAAPVGSSRVGRRRGTRLGGRPVRRPCHRRVVRRLQRRGEGLRGITRAVKVVRGKGLQPVEGRPRDPIYDEVVDPAAARQREPPEREP